MRLSRMFTAFAASYFALVFLRDGTAERLINSAASGARAVSRSGRRLTRRTF